MRRGLSFLGIVLVGCSSVSEVAKVDNRPPFDVQPGYPQAVLEQPEVPPQTVACGIERTSCARSLCGFSCPSGGLCQESCLSTDSRASAFLSVRVTGSQTLTLDSRTVPY